MKQYTNNQVQLASLALLSSQEDEDETRDAAADLYADAISCDKCFLDNLWPNFDAGCDLMLEVSAKAVKDLELLPNLKKIKGDNFDDLFDEAFLEALKKRNIVLEDTGY